MFYEYAIEPAVLSSWERVRYFLGAAGPWTGRLIAEYPRHWKKLVYQALDCPDVEKSRIVERLQRLDPRVFVRRSALYDSSKTWIENAESEHARMPFQAILAVAPTGRSHVLDATAMSDDHPMWDTHGGKMIARDEKAFTEALRLLLLVSSRVVLIDPYFRANNPNKTAPLQAFCRALGDSGAVVEVHFATACSESSLDNDERDREHTRHCAWCMSEAERVLPGALPAGTCVPLHAWRERPGGARLHNRFLITEVGGVQFGDGIERGARGHHDRLSILDEASRAQLWEQYVGDSPAFDPVGNPKQIFGARPPR